MCPQKRTRKALRFTFVIKSVRSAAWFLPEMKSSLSTAFTKLGSHSPCFHYPPIDSLVSPHFPLLPSDLFRLASPFPSLAVPSPRPPLPFVRVFPPSPSISSSSRRRHDSEEGDSHRRHKHKKSKRSKEGKEAGEDISGDQENQDAME